MTPSSLGRAALEDWQKQLYESFGLSKPAPPTPKDLEQLIRSHIHNLLPFAPNTSKEEIEAYFRRELEQLQALLKEAPPTSYEQLPAYIDILLAAHLLEEGVRNSPAPRVLPRPIFGTIPLGSVTAYTFREGTEYIVAFPFGLFSFAERMVCSVAATLPYKGVSTGIAPWTPKQLAHWFSLNPNDTRKFLELNTKVANCFTEAILAYVRWGRPDAAQMPPELSPERNVVASMLYGSFVQFVIAHEYGHLLHNHLLNQPAMEGGPAGRTIMWDWMKETEADVAACALLCVAGMTRPTNLAGALTGFEVFLSCYEIVERALSVLCVGNEEYVVTTERHPPARTRRQFLHKHLILRSSEFLKGPDAEAQMQSALKETLGFSQLLEVFWEQARPAVWRLYELGCEPSPIFKRVSDAKDSRDPAMLGNARERLKGCSPDVHGTLERAETLVVSGRRLIRASAAALRNDAPKTALLQMSSDEARIALHAAVKGIGQALKTAAQVLGELRSVLTRVVQTPLDPSQLDRFQTAADKVASAGEQLESAGLSKAETTALWKGGNLIDEAGQSLHSMDELSGVGVHFMQMGECLALASEALAHGELRRCWESTKLAGLMAVLSGECLICGAIELWRDRALLHIGGVLLLAGDGLRRDQLPDLKMLRHEFGLYKEVEYAVVSSCRRRASFYQNAVSLLPPAGAQQGFINIANTLKAHAVVLAKVFNGIADAESVLDRALQGEDIRSRTVETGQILEAAAQALGEAAVAEKELLGQTTDLTHIARVLSCAGSHIANRNLAAAAQLLEEYANRRFPGGWQVFS